MSGNESVDSDNLQRHRIRGTGLGLRLELLDALSKDVPEDIHFFEVAPENWMGVGGKHGKQFRRLTERHPFVFHGLSLSLGGPAPLDEDFLKKLKGFLDQHNILIYSEHLSYCGDDGHLYDLLPIPFTEGAVHYTAARIRRAQEILERRIAIENVSYYAAPGKEMEEADFVNAVLKEADCDLLLDVNNIYVNSVNHGYTPQDFLKAMPSERVAYLHVAGHYNEETNLVIDTHGADIIDPVWKLLEQTYRQFGVLPTLLERDFNIPPLVELLGEIRRINQLQDKNPKAVHAQAQHA